jgi:hypothetical protein
VSQSYPGVHEGIPAQFEEKFWRQLAKIMVRLASIRLPRIGSIVRDEADPDSFVIGPLIETGSGPYDSAAEFYADYPLALNRNLRKGEQFIGGQEELVQASRSLAASFLAPARSGNSLTKGFGLANYDLNPNNVLVDGDFNVLAVIDWDSTVAVPDAALYRFPFLMGVSCAVPGVIDTHPAVMKRQRLGRRFAGVVEAVAQELGRINCEDKNKPWTFLFTRSGFYSKEAIAFRALVHVKMRQDWVNRTWLEGLKWLSTHDEAEVTQFCLRD